MKFWRKNRICWNITTWKENLWICSLMLTDTKAITLSFLPPLSPHHFLNFFLCNTKILCCLSSISCFSTNSDVQPLLCKKWVFNTQEKINRWKLVIGSWGGYFCIQLRCFLCWSLIVENLWVAAKHRFAKWDAVKLDSPPFCLYFLHNTQVMVPNIWDFVVLGLLQECWVTNIAVECILVHISYKCFSSQSIGNKIIKKAFNDIHMHFNVNIIVITTITSSIGKLTVEETVINKWHQLWSSIMSDLSS